MAASQIWTVKAPSGTDIAAFKASKTLYEGAIGTEAGISAVAAAAARATPTYDIAELVKVGWLIPINVSLKQSAGGKTSTTTVYCSSEKAVTFVAKARTNPSGMVIGGKEVLSASYRTKQVLG